MSKYFIRVYAMSIPSQNIQGYMRAGKHTYISFQKSLKQNGPHLMQSSCKWPATFRKDSYMLIQFERAPYCLGQVTWKKDSRNASRNVTRNTSSRNVILIRDQQNPDMICCHLYKSLFILPRKSQRYISKTFFELISTSYNTASAKFYFSVNTFTMSHA